MRKFRPLLIIILLSTLCINILAAINYEIVSAKSVVNITTKGVYEIEEEFLLDFKEAAHGFYRVIPTRYYLEDQSGQIKVKVSKIKVNANRQLHFQNNDLIIQIGDANKYVIGEQLYKISYTYDITREVIQDSNIGFYFNLLGDKWETTIKEFSFEINLPKEIDEKTIEYLILTGRIEEAQITEAYAKTNNLFHDENKSAIYDEIVELDLTTVKPAIAGPSRPQDLILLSNADKVILEKTTIGSDKKVDIVIDGEPIELLDGSVAIAAITSCTNTSNPSVMIAAGQLAKKAVERGLKIAPWVKTSLAPGSKVVSDYLEKSNLLPYLEKIGFNIVAYGCTTCIGNSGSLHPEIEKAQVENDLTLASVLSGNRNFEGRIHKNVKASFLMSPPLVVAYALAGRVDVDLSKDPIAYDDKGVAVYLNELWPDSTETAALASKYVTQKAFIEKYKDIFSGDKQWQELYAPTGDTYTWDENSTYIAKAPFFEAFSEELPEIKSIKDAYALLVMGDSVTTDHISPAGSIDPTYPSGLYLKSRNVEVKDFNSYGSRRGHHEVMVRGTFANTRIKQKLSAPKEGGFTKKLPEGNIVHVYNAAMAYQAENRDLIVIAKTEYGSGSSRDWAAKGARLLGIKAVLTESFERIHRSNLVGMGVLPLTFKNNETLESLGLTGEEQFSIEIPQDLVPRMDLKVIAKNKENKETTFNVVCRLDSPVEVTYYKNGGILHTVLRKMIF
jgi:aconitate hydratase